MYRKSKALQTRNMMVDGSESEIKEFTVDLRARLWKKKTNHLTLGLQVLVVITSES